MIELKEGKICKSTWPGNKLAYIKILDIYLDCFTIEIIEDKTKHCLVLNMAKSNCLNELSDLDKVKLL